MLLGLILVKSEPIRRLIAQRVGFSGCSAVKNQPAGQEMQVPSLGWEDPLEKGMATHSSIWRIPWTEEPAGLQSMGCKETDMTERLTLSNIPQWLSTEESACNTGDTGDSGLIPGSRSPGGGNGKPTPVIPAWKILWTEEPGGLQSMRVTVRHN